MCIRETKEYQEKTREKMREIKDRFKEKCLEEAKQILCNLYAFKLKQNYIGISQELECLVIQAERWLIKYYPYKHSVMEHMVMKRNGSENRR